MYNKIVNFVVFWCNYITNTRYQCQKKEGGGGGGWGIDGY